MKVMKKNIIKKVIESLTELSQDEGYDEWYRDFSKNIKLGIHEDATNRGKLAKLLKYVTSTSKGELRGLDEHIKNMKENQKNIYYMTGESLLAIRDSIFLEKFKKNDIEVLLMTDPIDEYCMQQLKDFDSKTFVNITKEKI